MRCLLLFVIIFAFLHYSCSDYSKLKSLNSIKAGSITVSKDFDSKQPSQKLNEDCSTSCDDELESPPIKFILNTKRFIW